MSTNAVMHLGEPAARRRLILALGRGRSGKTIWSRWIVEAMRARGKSPVAADADDITHGLSRDDEGALRLGPGLREERPWWSAVLANGEDFGGRPVVVDFSPDSGLIQRVDPEGTDFAGRYAALGFDLTKVFFFASDVGDVRTFMSAGAMVTATDTLLVLNEGAIGSRRDDRFDAILAHPAVREAVERGALVVRMPELHLGLDGVGQIANFRAFAEGGGAAKPLSFERHAVATWLGRMEQAFAPFSHELALG
jgi:hypothetical protein